MIIAPAVEAADTPCIPLTLVAPAKTIPFVVDVAEKPTDVLVPTAASTDTDVTVKKASVVVTVFALGPTLVSVTASPFSSVPVIVKLTPEIFPAEVKVTVVAMFDPSLTELDVNVKSPAPAVVCKAATAAVSAETALNIFACILVLDILSPN